MTSSVVFCGLSKNSFPTLKKNSEFIKNFINLSKFSDVKFLVVDSDSDDGSKKFLNQLSKSEINIEVIHKDFMNESSSRIEKISTCRNIGINFIKDLYISTGNLIYIPCDLDLDLFSKTTISDLEFLIDKVIHMGKKSALFPVSIPYYYDIFALRAKGWLNMNSQLFVSKLKKNIKIFSFLWNYFFIFRFQLKPEAIEKLNLNVSSAFGGMAIYNLNEQDLNIVKYKTSSKQTDWYSEHIYFNEYFTNLEIDTTWQIEAPIEHIEYKNYNLTNKLKYILKTIKYDFKNLIYRN